MRHVVIENPIINSPFDEPTRHFRFSNEGITSEIVETRRISSYFVPIAQPKKKGAKQLHFDTEWTQDRIEENRPINDILAVCGFAVDPHVAEEVKRYGKLTVLPANMNPDLTMGDELLKKTGVEEPYDKLKRALQAEIDEAAWSSLHTTVSRPFSRSETGEIAVKVINHYGDEVLKVFHI